MIKAHKTSGDMEIVLQGGAFCRIRKIVWDDIVSSHDENPYIAFTNLVCKVITIDDREVLPETFRKLQLDFVGPIVDIVSREITRCLKQRGIA